MIDTAMFKRFITFDRAFQVRVAIVVVLLFVIRWEGQEAGKQGVLLSKLSAEQAMVLKIPAMQAELVALEQAAAAKEAAKIKPKVDNGFHLEGIMIDNNDFTALVNGEIHVVGDVIGKYKIVQITAQGVAVSNAETGLPEMISLPEDLFTEK
jgi:hypothetical protein